MHTAPTTPRTRRVALIAPLVLFALLLAACGGSDDSNSGDAASEETEGHNGHGGNSAAADDARTINVEASSFEFDPPTIEATTGEDLAIELTATDAEHDFVIDELDAHVVAGKGETATSGFNVGDDPGTYTYYCSVTGHRQAGMEGELVVQ